MAVNLIINFRVLAEHREAFVALLEGVRQGLPKVPGCLGVTAYANQSDRQAFTLVERWASTDDHAVHLARLQASGDWGRLGVLLEAPPSSGYYAIL